MDALLAHDCEQAQRTKPAEKLRQALETMRAGIRFKRSTRHRQFPQADGAELDRLLVEWLCSDD